MKVFKDITEFDVSAPSIVTTGTFDGVHKGHAQILSKLVSEAKANYAKSVVLTFFPHPRLVLFPDDNDLKQINTLNERINLLREAGVDYLIVQEFTKEFSRLSALEYARNVLAEKLKTKKIIVGYDHRFGRNREGSFEQLKEFGTMFGFEVEEISKQMVEELAVSSTKVRNAIIEGDIMLANSLLNYSFYLTGKVVQGNNLGRTIGFPTANIFVNESYKLIPHNGVYAVTVSVKNQKYKGMMNIGIRPTVEGRTRTIEVNILDFNTEIYNEEIKIEFQRKIRDEVKFASIDDLKAQLKLDEAFVRNASK